MSKIEGEEETTEYKFRELEKAWHHLLDEIAKELRLYKIIDLIGGFINRIGRR